MSTTGNTGSGEAAGRTLVIEGDLALAQCSDDGRALIVRVRRALATGGRGMLAGAGGTKRYEVIIDLFTVRISLHPLIARRLYTSGAELTEDEIRVGMEQLRETNEDAAQRHRRETEDAITVGVDYARAKFDEALTTGNERSLHNAWEMARKVNGLRKRLAAMDHDAPTWVCDGCMGRVVRSEIADMADGEHVLCRRCAA